MNQDIKCFTCDQFLTQDEYDFYKTNELIEQLHCHYYCKQHWCECMPQTTPWAWLTPCSICHQVVCKSCKYIAYGGLTTCSDCYQRMENAFADKFKSL
jgi:hypothetical protein